MKNVKLLLVTLALLLGTTPNAFASGPSDPPRPDQPGQPMPAADKTAPSYDMKAQSILDLQSMQKKFVDLANAIPADKYSWRPADGVRSISEVFLHIVAANYNIPTMMGAQQQPAYTQDGFEKSTTDKAAIVGQLNKSFAYAEDLVQNMSNADFARPEKKLGPDANAGDVVYILVAHAHEHLGQSIAYARLNGVVPPWSADAAKKNGQKPQD